MRGGIPMRGVWHEIRCVDFVGLAKATPLLGSSARIPGLSNGLCFILTHVSLFVYVAPALTACDVASLPF
jgi:hypothetical protein